MVVANERLTRRRVLLVITVILLVAGSTAIGWLAATWPHWRGEILG